MRPEELQQFRVKQLAWGLGWPGFTENGARLSVRLRTCHTDNKT
jgi:hypothetical protein